MPTACEVDTPFRLEIDAARELVGQYGSPLYVLSERHFRAKIREYRAAFAAAYPRTELSYASKANNVFPILKIAYEEGLNVDVASEGEFRGALRAGVPASDCEFHGNNKGRDELQFALAQGIHRINVDNFQEIELLRELWPHNSTTELVLRLAPGVDPITHEKVSTGQEDSKFGFNISDGSAEKALRRCLELQLPVVGVHCHVGSQLLDPQAQIDGGLGLATFVAAMRERLGFEAKIVNLGGGLGVPTAPGEKVTPVGEYCRRLVEQIRPTLESADLQPTLVQEPGRALINECGVTLYTVGTIKEVPVKGGRKTYVSIDGGLSDNPRPALYGARYQLEIVGKGTPDATYTVSGKHCEADEMFPNVKLPREIATGDLLQVFNTGAYTTSMAGNYNRLPRPATVLIRESGEAHLAQKRESWTELFSRDVQDFS